MSQQTIGVVLPPISPPEALWEAAERADELDIHSVWVTDRTLAGVPWLETFSVLGGLAARTRRVQLGTSVLVPARRNPVLVAHGLASIDFLSEGRLTAGIGAGGLEAQEFDIADVPLDKRGELTDEYIELMRRLWTEANVTHRGEGIECEDVTVLPQPHRPIPIWTGGSSPPARRRAARLADGWLGIFLTPEQYEPAWQEITDAAVDAGRDPDAIVPAIYLFSSIAPTEDEAKATLSAVVEGLFGVSPDQLPHACLWGTPDDWVDRLTEYGRAGVAHANTFLVSQDLPRDIELIGRDVAPRLPTVVGRPQVERQG